MHNLAGSYSEIISPKDYNHLMTNEHLYIAAADKFITKTIKENAHKNAEVVELGCGPARVLSLTSQIPDINLTGVDIDINFLDYSKKTLKDTSVQLKYDNVENYQHNKPVDIFYSQGFHHHIAKGPKKHKYLTNIFNQLKPGGVYILSDEFIPHYDNEKEREIRLVIWYSHIITHALRHKYFYLAREEAKTLLDDIYEGRDAINIKTPKQIEFTLASVTAIDAFSRRKFLREAEILAQEFLITSEQYQNLDLYNDPTLDFSRHDYKICENQLIEEIKNIGFKIKIFHFLKDTDSVAPKSIYILYKNDDNGYNKNFRSH